MGIQVEHIYQILRSYNNNIILVKNMETKGEAVLIGKGIGFGKKTGEIQKILPEAIDRCFLTYDDNIKNDYLELVQQLDASVMEVCAEIIFEAEEKLGSLNQRIHIVLTDHIGFALERMKSGIEIHNPFLDEIKLLYPEEYELGKIAQQLIDKNLGVKIAEDEVAFIALHLSAARESKEVSEAMKHTRIITELVQIIESELHIAIKKDLTYSRLIHHLRGTLDRLSSGYEVTNPILETLKVDMSESYKIAEKLKDKIEQSIEIIVPEGEIGFLAIHIDRLRSTI